MTRVLTDNHTTAILQPSPKPASEEEAPFNVDELAIYKMALSNIENKIQEKLTTLRMERSRNETFVLNPSPNQAIGSSGYNMISNSFTITQPVHVETIYDSESDYDEDIDLDMEDIKTYNY